MQHNRLGRHRAHGQHAVPGDHDLRRTEQQGRGPRPARPRGGGGCQFHRHGRDLSGPPAGRDPGADRDLHRHLAPKPRRARPAGPGQQGRRARGLGRLPARRQPPPGPAQHRRRPRRQPLSAPDGLPRPLPTPLAGPRDQLLRQARLRTRRGRAQHPLAGDPGGPGGPGPGRQGAPHRCLQRDPLGPHDRAAPGGGPRPAAPGEHPEPLQPTQPQLRDRAGGGGPARALRAPGLLPARPSGSWRASTSTGSARPGRDSPCSSASAATPIRSRTAPAPPTSPWPAATGSTRPRWPWPSLPVAPS